jgi:hypothetical protein
MWVILIRVRRSRKRTIAHEGWCSTRPIESGTAPRSRRPKKWLRGVFVSVAIQRSPRPWSRRPPPSREGRSHALE